MTQQPWRPESLYCTADGRYLAWYFHPFKFLCQVLHLKCFSFTIVAIPALDGMCPGRLFCGWRMDDGEILAVATCIPTVVNDGQFSLVPNYADKFNYLVLSSYPKGSPKMSRIQPLYTSYLSLDHWQQTLQWCPDVGYPITAVVERKVYVQLIVALHEAKECSSK